MAMNTPDGLPCLAAYQLMERIRETHRQDGSQSPERDHGHVSKLRVVLWLFFICLLLITLWSRNTWASEREHELEGRSERGGGGGPYPGCGSTDATRHLVGII